MNKPRGVINFDLVHCTLILRESKLRFSLRLKGCSRIFEFKCKNQSDFEKWVLMLTITIHSSAGFREDLGIDEKRLKVRFWGYDQISEEQFLEMADVGDLLLFRGNHFGAKLTRSLTSSTFDHVAMVIKL
mmetsp:Transcript_14846/g.10741  ORF Transcript_14846/g.10741 Transcript_14846/m.10741 type:complete len:130 (-) Transcript_14846:532-921(-)